MSTKEEIEKLTLELDDVLNECNPEDLLLISSQLKSATTNTKVELNNINKSLQTASIVGHDAVLKTAETTLTDLHELIKMTKTISSHLYGQLVSLDITDPNLVTAAAEFIRSTRESINDFIQLYRDEQEFLHKIQLSMLQFAQKKELLKYKAELDVKKNEIPLTPDSVNYSQEAVINFLND